MKNKILIIVAIIAMIIAIPLSANAYVTSGYIDATRKWSGGPHLKYTYINGADVSLYYIYSSEGSYYAYPIGTTNFPGAGDTPIGTPAYMTDWYSWTIGAYNSTIYPRIGGWYGDWGPQYTVTNINNDKVTVACALILLNGYNRSSYYTNWGIDALHAQYATNVALQNVTAMCGGGWENSSYSPAAGNEATAAFCYELGQIARRYLVNSTALPLSISPTSQAMTAEGSYFVSYVTFYRPPVYFVDPAQYYRNTYLINTASFPSGTVFEGYTGAFNASGYQTVKIKVPVNGNAGKSFSSYATGTYINRAAAVSIYNCPNYGRWVNADERTWLGYQDISTPPAYFSLTTPNKSDLTIISLTTNKTSYEANEDITITATVKNIGSISSGKSCICRISSPQLTAVDMGDKTIPALAPNATTTLTFRAKAPVLSGNTSIPVTVTADATNVIDEITDSNNSATVNILIGAAKPDFSCNFPISGYIADQDAVITVTVNNTGTVGHANVPVRLTVAGKQYNTTVPVPVGSNLAAFRVTMPNISGQVTITAAVDPDNTISEYNENNNTATHTAQVTILHTPQQIDTLDSGLEQTYLNKNKQIPDTPNNPDSTTHTWQEWRYEGGNYVLHTYTATLSMTFQVKPDSRITGGNTIESGFGLEQSAVATLTTNYDHPEKLVGIQNMWLTYPETCYGLDTGVYTGYYETMISSSPGVLSNAWSYPNNPNSVKNLPLHYVPLWYPDGRYTVLCTAFGAWSPNGQMNADLTDSVTVSGSMYDRITAVGY